MEKRITGQSYHCPRLHSCGTRFLRPMMAAMLGGNQLCEHLQSYDFFQLGTYATLLDVGNLIMSRGELVPPQIQHSMIVCICRIPRIITKSSHLPSSKAVVHQQLSIRSIPKALLQVPIQAGPRVKQGSVLGMCRLPVHLHDLIGRIRRTELQLMSDLNRRATQTEIADHVGISLSRLQLLNKAARQPTSTSAPLGKDVRTFHRPSTVDRRIVLVALTLLTSGLCGNRGCAQVPRSRHMSSIQVV